MTGIIWWIRSIRIGGETLKACLFAITRGVEGDGKERGH